MVLLVQCVGDNEMAIFCVNLNIHYSAPQEVWEIIGTVYAEMPFWKGYIDGCPQWYGEDGKMIEGSVEPSGLQLYAEMPEKEWREWLHTLKEKLTNALGYCIGEPEDGYEFRFWE